ncbi:expressed unknown protein [Seminavis robusta]|uniref:Uncharacterized protein n=1 Tax=Seminavis robusta TaxID=568900 RepID=A0A9N8EN05_9STRA|nr:expressed unknown protein [Seminavis robusta]|eukprot:Sro1586_g284180.1 n/a (284) ;mRNA; f:6527-7378
MIMKQSTPSNINSNSNTLIGITNLSGHSHGSGEFSVGSNNGSRKRSSPIKKSIQWELDSDGDIQCATKLVECFANLPDGKESIWYEGKELGAMRKKDIKSLKHAQVMAGTSSIESDEITWRGFEDIEGCWCRVEKSADYTTAVVRHYHAQLSQGYFDPEELKKIAKGLSKQERTRVRQLALKDAAAVGNKTGILGRPSTIRRARSNVTTASNGMKRVSSSSSGGMKKVRSSAGLKKVGSINQLRLGVQKARKSVSNLSNFQWGVKKNGSKENLQLAAVTAAAF